MSEREVEKGKYYKKKYNRNEQTLFGRNNRLLLKNDKEGRDGAGHKIKLKQPQILIKPREKIEEHTLSPKHKDREEICAAKEPAQNATEGQLFHNAKQMHKAVKLLDDGILYNDNLQDYMNESGDFLVVGVIGSQGVGKSTIMNILASEKYQAQLCKLKKGSGENLEDIKSTHCIFKQETFEDLENCTHITNGIDMFITPNRMILLDCQPFMSTSVIDDLIHNEMKRTNLLDYSTIDNIGELQGLQHIAFLMSVCHVVIFIQDFILDINNIRFVLTAEMLKPTITNNEEEYSEQFPHLLILHNKAQLEDFSLSKFKNLQEAYQNICKGSKLHVQSMMGLGNGKSIRNLNPTTCGTPINLFLLPDFDHYDGTYTGYPPLSQLLQTLRRNVSCVTKYPLSHVSLTEKTWLVYCTKVWEHVKKSSFYVEYAKILP